MGLHSTRSNTTAMHGIVKKTVADAAALAAQTPTATELADRSVWLQTDTRQLWVPKSTTAGDFEPLVLLGGAAANLATSAAAGTSTAVSRSDHVHSNVVPVPVAATQAAQRDTVDAATIPIQAVTAAALPAYTVISGSVAAGTAVFEANANGAFPTLDGNASVTAAASGEAVSSRFLLHHGAANTDNGVMTLTVQGDGGTKARWQQYSGLNTSAEILGSKLRVLAGEQSCGAEYVHLSEGTFTLGTTPLYYTRTDARACMNQVVRGYDECDMQAVVGASATAAWGLLSLITSGTGTGITQTNPSVAGVVGEYGFASGTTNAGICAIAGPLFGTLDANMGIDVSFDFMIPTLSTAAQEFIAVIGLFAGGVSVTVDGFCFVYDRLNKGVNLWAKTVSGGTSTATFTDTGIVVTAGRRYRGRLIRRAGDSAARYYIGSSADAFALVATHSANHPTASLMGVQGRAFKTAGTTSVTYMTVGSLGWDIQYPLGKAA